MSDATPPPPERGVSRPEAVTPGGSGQQHGGGLFSRIKKRVVETAWQGTESKVSQYKECVYLLAE